MTRTRAAAAMAFGSIVSVQLGAALATTLFSTVGPWGAVLMRSVFGALALLPLARGRLRRLRGRELREVVLFGLALAGMSLCFYAALDRLPLGVAVTLAVGIAVGVLSAAVPCALEMEALRRLPNATFGVLMSLEPAVATLVGFVALSQSLAPLEVLAIGLVVAACAGALRSAATPAPRDG